MVKREFIRVKSRFIVDRIGGGSRSRVPSDVRDKLGAKLDDSLVWEEGCDAAVTRAALKREGYFVVTLERGEAAPLAQPSPEHTGSPENATPPQLESLAEAVARKRRGE